MWPGRAARERPLILDAALAVAVLGLGMAEVWGGVLGTVFPGSRAVHTLFLVAGTVPVVTRRRWPLGSLIAVVVIQTAWIDGLYGLREQQPPLQPYLVMLVIVYSAAVYANGRSARAAAVVIVVAVLSDIPVLVAGAPIGNVVPPNIFVFIAFGLGLVMARYRRDAESSEQRVSELEREQQEAARRAVAEERSRIARELHDVISHDVSLMVLQASVERRVMSDDRDGRATTGQTLATIESTGREALAELRRMLGVLRRGEDTAPLQPQPGLAQLPELVSQAREAGLAVDLVITGDPQPVPAGLDLAAYRIVQESLTNVAKHATGGSAIATLRYTPGALEIDVLDTGAAATAAIPGDGHGLVGMRERVALYGGTLDTGRAPGGGFRVRARIPLDVPA